VPGEGVPTLINIPATIISSNQGRRGGVEGEISLGGGTKELGGSHVRSQNFKILFIFMVKFQKFEF
jgi:hypothetical protein